MKSILGCAVVVALGGILAPTSPSLGEEKKTADDQSFVMQATAAGLAEVNLGRIGAKQASSEDVKKFAEHVVKDHTKANNELISLADKKRFPVAQTMDRQHQTLASQMARLTGPDFDRLFMGQMVKDHEEAVALFESASKSSTDKDLKEWATKTLPTLQEHLKTAKDVEGKLKRGGDR